jgi:hypothetical protein
VGDLCANLAEEYFFKIVRGRCCYPDNTWLQESSVRTMESREHSLALFGCQSRIRGDTCWGALAILLRRCTDLRCDNAMRDPNFGRVLECLIDNTVSFG